MPCAPSTFQTYTLSGTLRCTRASEGTPSCPWLPSECPSNWDRGPGSPKDQASPRLVLNLTGSQQTFAKDQEVRVPGVFLCCHQAERGGWGLREGLPYTKRTMRSRQSKT